MLCSDENVFIVVTIVLELSLRDDLFLFLLSILCGSCIFTLALSLLFRLLDLLLLFIVLSFLQTDEILTIDLVKLLLDIINDFRDTGDEDELQRVHTPVRHLEGYIEGDELCLQGCNCYQNLEELGELLTSALDGLAAHAQAEKVAVSDLIDIFELEDGDVDTGDVIFLHGHAHWRAYGDMILHGATKITRGELSLSHTHASISVVETHSHL